MKLPNWFTNSRLWLADFFWSKSDRAAGLLVILSGALFCAALILFFGYLAAILVVAPIIIAWAFENSTHTGKWIKRVLDSTRIERHG